jgi:hypothetical protein
MLAPKMSALQAWELHRHMGRGHATELALRDLTTQRTRTLTWTLTQFTTEGKPKSGRGRAARHPLLREVFRTKTSCRPRGLAMATPARHCQRRNLQNSALPPTSCRATQKSKHRLHQHHRILHSMETLTAVYRHPRSAKQLSSALPPEMACSKGHQCSRSQARHRSDGMGQQHIVLAAIRRPICSRSRTLAACRRTA